MARAKTQFGQFKMFRLSPLTLLILLPLVLVALAIFTLFMLGSGFVSAIFGRRRVGHANPGGYSPTAAYTVENGASPAAAHAPSHAKDAVIEAEFRHVN